MLQAQKNLDLIEVNSKDLDIGFASGAVADLFKMIGETQKGVEGIGKAA